MMLGVITTKHILLHPLMMIGQLGFLGYFRVVGKCLDDAPHCFVEFLRF